MKIIKNIISVLLEPFKILNNRNFGEKVVNFFQSHKFMYYIVATFFTLLILFMMYVFPNII